MPFDSPEDTRLNKLIEANPLPTWTPLIILFAVTIASCLTWAWVTEIEETTTVEAKVVPKGDLKVVQHLEGGIIQELFVREGSQVVQDQPLVRLDIRASNSKQDEIEVQLYSQMSLRARLEAEAGGRAPIFPEEVRQRYPQIVETQQRAYDARKTELESGLGVLRSSLSQKEQDGKDLRGKLNTVNSNLELGKVRLDDASKLIKDRLISRDEYRKLEAEIEDLRSGVNSLREQIGKADAAVEEARARIAERNNTFRREAQTELSTVVETVSKLREALTTSGEKGARLEIRAPIDGIVKNMRYSTIGGVVKPGEPIMEIVPTGDTLVVSAKLDPADRGFVSVGQPAMVKISTYDYTRYGGLAGHVTLVGGDATTDDQAQGKAKAKQFFEVIVETDKSYLGKREGELPITPGMQATVDIHTGQKTVINYFHTPVRKMIAEAFRER
ncbi:MAG: putative rane-fusion protein [Rhodospirillales bacterium]|nr:putative rane-fusion protein [Rhodospirillales bacterium]